MKFRKRPVVIEAWRFPWDKYGFPPEEFEKAVIHKRSFDGLDSYRFTKTLEGTLIVTNGDWIIKGVNGEFYPCKHDIFLKTYEPLDE